MILCSWTTSLQITDTNESSCNMVGGRLVVLTVIGHSIFKNSLNANSSPR